jgi:uncharacterized protein (DUF433 family)
MIPYGNQILTIPPLVRAATMLLHKAGLCRYTERVTAVSGMSALLKRITINPDQCGGRPCIREMRIRVQDIIGLLASGASRDEILQEYPYLESDDISAALEYAASALDHTIIQAAE